MRHLSLWAKLHPHKARVVIILIKFVLPAFAYFIGRWIYEAQWNISSALLILVSAILFLAAMVVYPNRSNYLKSRRRLYVHQKTCDLILASTTFLMMIGIFNSPALSLFSSISSAAAPTELITENPEAARILASLQYRDKKSLTRHEKRVLKHEFGSQVKLYILQKASGQNQNADKTILIILTIIGAIGLLLLLGALSCSISCGGAEGLALLVFLVGLVGLTLGTAAVIRNIKKHYKRKKQRQTDPPPTE